MRTRTLRVSSGMSSMVRTAPKRMPLKSTGEDFGQPLYGAVENHGIVSPRRTRGVVLRPINEAQEQSEDAKDEDADDEIIRSCFHAYDALAISRPRSPQKYSLTQG